jgi:hypothetical protein
MTPVSAGFVWKPVVSQLVSLPEQARLVARWAHRLGSHSKEAHIFKLDLENRSNAELERVGTGQTGARLNRAGAVLAFWSKFHPTNWAKEFQLET